ncbi:hypothetical protein ACOZ38_25370 [Sphaerisporangium viridialbum]|uniref:hypothetical protein n=1 Tax=Sphaerisporangium viridialbum TaxID=46189 RepID=UPI003C76EDE9
MEISTNPAELFDAIEHISDRHPKTFGRMGISRPIGFVVLGLAATGRLSELALSETESSIADRIMTGAEITDVPAACIATLGTGKNAAKFTTYALIGMHVAGQVGFGEATIKELGKVPGTSAASVQKFLAELPSMEDHRKQAEARRKAQAKRTADLTAVRQVWKFAEKFKAPHTSENYAEVMADRDLTWEQVGDMIAAFTRESDAAAKADADAAKADA